MFERIVVGTDGSETAAEAVRQATELAKATGAKLDIVSAYRAGPAAPLREETGEIPGDVAYGVGPREDVNVDARARRRAGAARPGSRSSTHPREGDPADAILDVAEEIDADLIVVGNKGMTGARRFLLGSVPNKVSHHAPCGVLHRPHRPEVGEPTAPVAQPGPPHLRPGRSRARVEQPRRRRSARGPGRDVQARRSAIGAAASGRPPRRRSRAPAPRPRSRARPPSRCRDRGSRMRKRRRPLPAGSRRR